jgi:hypothetical protein
LSKNAGRRHDIIVFMSRSACLVLLGLAVTACSFNSNVGSRGGDAAVDDVIDANVVVPLIDADPEEPCTANEIVCSGQVKRTCQADGTGYVPGSEVVCPFTCEGAGECTAVSNLAPDVYTGCTGGPSLSPPTGAIVTYRSSGPPGPIITCSPHCGEPTRTSLQANSTIPSSNDAVGPMAYFCLSEINIPGDVVVQANAVSGVPQSSLVFVVDGPVTIDGTFSVAGENGDRFTEGRGGPGGGAGGDHSGGAGNDGSGPCKGFGGDRAGTSSNYAAGGGGGGGYAGRGGEGGKGRNPTGGTESEIGPAGGDPPCGNSALEPLFAGSGGGGGADGTCNAECGWPGGGGGGAVQISSRVSITVAGGINASGGMGYGETGAGGNGGGGGGGSGGAVLLESPIISILGRISVAGGDGGTVDRAGGAGATGDLDGENGDSNDGAGQGGGGGGGGAGRVRINSGNGASCAGVATPEEEACTESSLKSAQ